MTVGNGIHVRDLKAGYGGQQVVHGVDLHVEPGELVAVLGPNGAGKTTTLLALAGAIKSSGQVEMFGAPVAGRLVDRAELGLAFLPESRAIIRRLTVAENLRLSGADADTVRAISPELEPLMDRRVGLLSGGEQQILSLTQAIAIEPKILMADELSFGLAPMVVHRMLALARDAADRGAAVLLVEQFAHQVLAVADRGYVMQRGAIVTEGSAAQLLSRIDDIETAYLGTRDHSYDDSENGSAEADEQGGGRE